MAKVFSFINYKGGVGKTTTTYHIGCSLAYHHNKRVLLVDIDPQTNLTFLCKDFKRYEAFKERNGTILTLFRNYKEKKGLTVSRCIWQNPIGYGPTKVNNVDLLPCDLDLLGEDILLRISEITTGEYAFERLAKEAKETIRNYLFLKEVLRDVSQRYDYILIDCPPNLYTMTQNALIASDYYIITTIPEYLSLIGLRILIRKIGEIKEKVKKIASFAEIKLEFAELGGIIFVKVRIGGSILTIQHETNMATIKNDKELGSFCFESYTTELIGYSEAAESRLPVWLCDTDNARRAARKLEYENITKEFLRRFPL
jgi:chromosome partitioning protein